MVIIPIHPEDHRVIILFVRFYRNFTQSFFNILRGISNKINLFVWYTGKFHEEVSSHLIHFYFFFRDPSFAKYLVKMDRSECKTEITRTFLDMITTNKPGRNADHTQHLLKVLSSKSSKSSCIASNCIACNVMLFVFNGSRVNYVYLY